MGTLRTEIKAALTGNAALMAVLTGGVLDAQDLPHDGGGAGSAPRLADRVQVKPYAVIRWGSDTGYQQDSNALGAGRETFEVYIYQHKGYDTIEDAVGKIKALLNDQYITATDRAIAHVLYVQTSGELPSKELGMASCKFSRYQVIHIRK